MASTLDFVGTDFVHPESITLTGTVDDDDDGSSMFDGDGDGGTSIFDAGDTPVEELITFADAIWQP